MAEQSDVNGELRKARLLVWISLKMIAHQLQP